MNRMPRWRNLQLFFYASAFASGALAAQVPRSPVYRHRVLGVYDVSTGEPIEGASVTDLKSGTVALTTKTGTVDLVFLPDGGSQVRVRKMGYHPGAQFVAISPMDTVPVTMLLAPAATPLPAIVATDSARRYNLPTLRDFEERRLTGRGHFISEVELRKSDSRKMQDVVRRFPGLQVLCTRSGFYSCEAVATRSVKKVGTASDCRYTVLVDGVPLRDPDLNKLDVMEFAGIEGYTAGERIPTRYNMMGNPCGVLLFWTRER